MPKKGAYGHFRFIIVKGKGIRFYLRDEERFDVYQMIGYYLSEFAVGKISVAQKVVIALVFEVWEKFRDNSTFTRPRTTVTISVAQALAIWTEINTKRICATDAREHVILNNIFAAIDKTLV